MKQIIRISTKQGLIVEVDLKHIIKLSKGDKVKSVILKK